MTFTIAQVAEKYGVNASTVLSWIKSGDLPAINVGRSIAKKKPRWRVTASALEQFEQLRTATPPPPPAPRRTRKKPNVIQFYS
jgi:excisionase family DNA binding protein